MRGGLYFWFSWKSVFLKHPVKSRLGSSTGAFNLLENSSVSSQTRRCSNLHEKLCFPSSHLTHGQVLQCTYRIRTLGLASKSHYKGKIWVFGTEKGPFRNLSRTFDRHFIKNLIRNLVAAPAWKSWKELHIQISQDSWDQKAKFQRFIPYGKTWHLFMSRLHTLAQNTKMINVDRIWRLASSFPCNLSTKQKE